MDRIWQTNKLWNHIVLASVLLICFNSNCFIRSDGNIGEFDRPINSIASEAACKNDFCFSIVQDVFFLKMFASPNLSGVSMVSKWLTESVAVRKGKLRKS